MMFLFFFLDILSPDKPVVCPAPVTALRLQYFIYLHAYEADWLKSFISKIKFYFFNQQMHNMWCQHFCPPYYTPTCFDAYHHHQGVSLYTKITKSINVKSPVIYWCQNKVNILKHDVVLYSKPVRVLQVYLNYNQCAIYTVISVWIYVPWGHNPVNESQWFSRMYNTVPAKMWSKAIGLHWLWSFLLKACWLTV